MEEAVFEKEFEKSAEDVIDSKKRRELKKKLLIEEQLLLLEEEQILNEALLWLAEKELEVVTTMPHRVLYNTLKRRFKR